MPEVRGNRPAPPLPQHRCTSQPTDPDRKAESHDAAQLRLAASGKQKRSPCLPDDTGSRERSTYPGRVPVQYRPLRALPKGPASVEEFPATSATGSPSPNCAAYGFISSDCSTPHSRPLAPPAPPFVVNSPHGSSSVYASNR